MAKGKIGPKAAVYAANAILLGVASVLAAKGFDSAGQVRIYSDRADACTALSSQIQGLADAPSTAAKGGPALLEQARACYSDYPAQVADEYVSSVEKMSDVLNNPAQDYELRQLSEADLGALSANISSRAALEDVIAADYKVESAALPGMALAVVGIALASDALVLPAINSRKKERYAAEGPGKE